MNSFYTYIASDNSTDLFKNTAYDFTVYLPDSLKFQDSSRLRSRSTQWVVGIAEMQYTLTQGEAKNNMLEIYSDICTNSIIHDKKKPILRNITTINNGLRAVTLHKNFNPIIYIPLNKTEIRQIRTYINNTNGTPSTHLAGVTRITLHFLEFHKKTSTMKFVTPDEDLDEIKMFFEDTAGKNIISQQLGSRRGLGNIIPKVKYSIPLNYYS